MESNIYETLDKMSDEELGRFFDLMTDEETGLRVMLGQKDVTPFISREEFIERVRNHTL